MFRFIHGYLPDVWEAQVEAGLVHENDGIRFCQNIMLEERLKFNQLAAVNSELYKILSERKCVFYIDRLQGGVYIDEYPYDQNLLQVYKDMLGENFWGFQMHEWMSNYRADVFNKLNGLAEDEWTKEGIESFIYEKYPLPYLFLESMTAQEMADAGRPRNSEEFYENITRIYKKRMETGELIPCDSGYLAYAFEIACGAKRLMPEVGAQTPNARIQICYARGMTRKAGRSFGIYYEPWGGRPFSTCCYQRDGKNEWGITNASDFQYEAQGENGGSSRSLQRRIFLYGFLSGTEFISEEWGLCNVFSDWAHFALSPYGQIKKEFVDFVRKHRDIGEKIVPIAAVLPKEMMVLDNLYQDDVYCGFTVDSKPLAEIKSGIRSIFANGIAMLGTEVNCLKNSDIPDAIDLLNEDEEILSNYPYLINLTSDPEFGEKYGKVCAIEDIKPLLREQLPCYVDGNAHWMVNECKSGGYYLTIFNHSGIERTVEYGERELPEAESTVQLELKNEMHPMLCDGNGKLSCHNGVYSVTIPAGGWSFIQLSNT